MCALSWMRRLARVAVVVSLVSLAACGDEAAEKPAATSTPDAGTPTVTPTSDVPSCDDVWRTGERLARGYAGCESDGEEVPVDSLRCSSGQKFITFKDTHYAVVGGVVREAVGSTDSDADYRKAVRSCRG